MNVLIWLTHKDVSDWEATPEQIEDLSRNLDHRATLTNCATKEEFLQNLPRADVALVWRFKAEWFERAPRLKLLSTPSAGHEYLPDEAPDGVEIHFGSFHGSIMAETVLAMMLGLSRGVVQRARDLAPPLSLAWPRKDYSGKLGTVCGSHVVVLGFGNIGQWIAFYAKRVGATITGVRRNPDAELPDFLDELDKVVGLEELDTVLPTADHLVMVLPGTTATDNIMDARRLALLKPQARLYNVGRGNSLDEMALVEALNNQKLASAALDVFATEPLPADSPLRTARSCYLYPHISALAPEYLDMYFDEVASLLGDELAR